MIYIAAVVSTFKVTRSSDSSQPQLSPSSALLSLPPAWYVRNQKCPYPVHLKHQSGGVRGEGGHHIHLYTYE